MTLTYNLFGKKSWNESKTYKSWMVSVSKNGYSSTIRVNECTIDRLIQYKHVLMFYQIKFYIYRLHLLPLIFITNFIVISAKWTLEKNPLCLKSRLCHNQIRIDVIVLNVIFEPSYFQKYYYCRRTYCPSTHIK
jgi:hypothetical protein